MTETSSSVTGYWATHRYANSWTGQLADWTSCGLVKSLTSQLMDGSTHG